MDSSDVAGWILEFLLQQPSVTDDVLNSLLSSLPLPSNNSKFTKSVHLRRIETEIAEGTVSDDILVILELINALDNEARVPSTEALKRAYCSVAVECTVLAGGDAAEYSETVKRIWRGKVEEMVECGLVSHEFVEWRDVVEAATWGSKVWERLREKWRVGDALGAVREYVKEAWEGLGPSFIEVVAEVLESDVGARVVLGLREKDGEGDNVEPQRGTPQPRRKYVAKKRSTKSVAGPSRGAKITDPEEENQDLSNIYGSLPSLAIVKILEALRNNAPKPNSMTPKSTAQTYQGGDSIDNLREGDGESRSIVNLPSPKNRVVSPVKKHEMKNRRKMKFWSPLEQNTLISGVKKYGKGNWKDILNAYRDVFVERTEVDLKDKWRNMTRFSHFPL